MGSPLETALTKSVLTETGCWEYQGYRMRGYGAIARPGSGRPRWLKAHRVTWIAVNGPVPEGLEISHLCENPPCCNPKHLVAETHIENLYRSVKLFERKAFCNNGHAMTPENRLGADGTKGCRQCRIDLRALQRRAAGKAIKTYDGPQFKRGPRE